MSFASMLGGLTRAKIRFVVIGGVAAAVHGSSRVTNDLDICYEPEERNTISLARLLAAWDAYPRGVDRGLPFIMDERTLEQLCERCPSLLPDSEETLFRLLRAVRHIETYSATNTRRGRPGEFPRGTLLEVGRLDCLE